MDQHVLQVRKIAHGGNQERDHIRRHVFQAKVGTTIIELEVLSVQSHFYCAHDVKVHIRGNLHMYAFIMEKQVLYSSFILQLKLGKKFNKAFKFNVVTG